MQQLPSRDRLDAGAVNDRALTGLRGAAALMVVAHHCMLAGLLPQPLWPDLYRGAYLAVDLFFVLSGYVMALAYAHWFVPGEWGAARYAAFVLRRLARLWPLHAAVTAALLAAGWLGGGWPFWPKLIVANALLIQGWGISQSINPPSWSVSTELAAYLLLPALSAAALHGSPKRAWLMALAAATLLVGVALLAPDAPGSRRGLLDLHGNWSMLPLLRCLGGFMTGLLLFRAVRNPAVLHVLAQPWTGPAVAAAVVAMAGLRVPDLLTYPLLPVLVGAVHHGRGWLPRSLGGMVPHQIGVLSYALYLVHYPILSALPRGMLPAGFEFAACAGLSLAAAYAAHKLVELPGRRAVMRLGGLLRQPAPQ